MPSTYAHYRFGCEVYCHLPEEVSARISKYRTLYLTGLHGPDLMFYYRPLCANPVNQIGYQLHDWTGRALIERGARVVKESSSYGGAWAYLCGVVCHFTLDSLCHPYVEEKIRRSHVTHTEIEGAFDRALMVHDGINPISHRLADHIIPSKESAEIIAPFYAPATVEQVYQAMGSMIKNCNLLTAPSAGKRRLVRAILKLSGNYPEMHGMMITRERDPQFSDSDRELYRLYRKGIREAPAMIEEMTEHLERGRRLGKRFDHTFGVK